MHLSLRRRIVSLATLALVAAAAVPASASAAIQLGVYTPGAPANAQAMSDYTAMVGRQPEIVMSYRDFNLPLLYSNEVSNLRATGQTPLISWEPYGSLSSIASGSYDSYLHEQARAAKSWGSTMMLRFGHEMNGTWYSWSGDPESFVAAWRHVVSVFRADGVTNVKWVWSPNVQEGTKYQMSPYFPGDEWIDYVGLDGYNWGSGEWQSLQQVFASSYTIATQLSTKPVIITETSSSESGGDKAAWIRNGFITAIPQSFPRVTAVVWFNRTQEDDWRIDSSQASLDAYRAVASCSAYGGPVACGEAAPAPTPPGKKKGKKRLTVQSVNVTRRVSSDVSGTVSFAVSEPAQVKIEIIPRRQRGRSIKVTRRSRRGHNRVTLQRLVRRRSLPEGKYRVVITARNPEGERAHPHRARFRVV